MKCIKAAFLGTRKRKKKRGRIKAGLESGGWAARGLKSPEAHFIFLSAAFARKQSQVTDLMLITPGLPPFRKTKADAGLCCNLVPSLL